MTRAHGGQVRQLAVVLCTLVVFIASRSSCADEVSPQEAAKTLAAQAEARKQEYKDYRPSMPVYSDSEQLQRLAEIGRARGRAEFDAMSKAATGPASAPASAPTQETSPASAGLVIVALSSSMPLPMLRDYIAQLDGVPGTVVVLRGFIGGATKVKPTGRWIEEILRERSDCLQCAHRRVRIEVDPLLYKSLGIKQVPAVTFLAGVRDLQHCQKEQFKSAAVAYGAVAVEAALRAITKEGVAVPAGVLARYEARQ